MEIAIKRLISTQSVTFHLFPGKLKHKQAQEEIEDNVTCQYNPNSIDIHYIFLKLYNKQNLILVDTVKNPEKYGVIYEKNNIIEKIIEKPKNPKSKIVNLGTYILEKSIFSYIKNTKKSKSGEVYITDTFQNMIDDGKKFYIHKINKEYKDLTYESDLNQ